MISGLSSFAVLAVFGCMPPLLCLIVSRQRVLRAREFNEAPGWLQAALVFSVIAFLLNIFLVTVSALRLPDHPGWSRIEAAVLLIGWAAFWLWIGLMLSRRSRRKRRIY